MRLQLTEYMYGLKVDHLETEDISRAKVFYRRSLTGMSAVRVYIGGKKLRYPESDRLLLRSDWVGMVRRLTDGMRRA